MKRVAVFALMLTAVLATSARAQTTVVASSDRGFDYQQWIDDSRVPTPDVTVQVHEEQGPCAEALACAEPSAIWIPAASWLSVSGAQKVFDHELGHVFDFTALTDQNRVEFMALVGLQGAWENPALRTASPNEWFADSYSLCARRPVERIRHANSAGSGVIGWPTMRAICLWFKSLP